eukprot:6208204-Pleurochrysis_carterae.AAC.7
MEEREELQRRSTRGKARTVRERMYDRSVENTQYKRAHGTETSRLSDLFLQPSQMAGTSLREARLSSAL